MARTTLLSGCATRTGSEAFAVIKGTAVFLDSVYLKVKPPLPVAFGHPDNKLSGPPNSTEYRRERADTEGGRTSARLPVLVDYGVTTTLSKVDVPSVPLT